MQLHVSHQKQAELVVVEIATESFFGVNRVYVVVDCTHDRTSGVGPLEMCNF